MSEDTIYREDAIEALGEEPYVWTDDDEFAQGERSQWLDDVSAIKAVPSADRPQGEVNAIEIYEQAERRLERSEISIGEFESIIDPLRHLYYDRPQGWIPCSERMPEEKEVVLITNDKGNVRFGQFRGTHGKYWIWKGNTLETVLAWMPLPKSYKGADDECVL